MLKCLLLALLSFAGVRSSSSSLSTYSRRNLEKFTALAKQRGYSKLHRHLGGLPTKEHGNQYVRSLEQMAPHDGKVGVVEYKSFDVTGLPEAFDWRSPANFAKHGCVVTPVKDQLSCGSCWAISAIQALESARAIKTGRLDDLSPAMVVDCAPNPKACGGNGGCQGSTPRIAFEYLADVGGAVPEYVYGYERDGLKSPSFDNGKHCRIEGKTNESGWAVAPVVGPLEVESNNATAVMHALMEYGPLAVAVDASNWANYTGGIFNCEAQAREYNEFMDVNHGVTLVGWGVETQEDGSEQKYWSLRNSWGTSFGEDGYIRIRRNDPDHVPCYKDRTPLNGVACKIGDDGRVRHEIPEFTACGACGVLFDVVGVIVSDQEEQT